VFTNLSPDPRLVVNGSLNKLVDQQPNTQDYQAIWYGQSNVNPRLFHPQVARHGNYTK
jgi:hypothetical protein